MRKILALLVLLYCNTYSYAQTATSLVVGGDLDKFYPIVFQDSNWGNHAPTELKIGRSDVHYDETWRGSLMAKFVFHTTRWGNGANFADIELYQKFNLKGVLEYPFIAGFHDATTGNSNAYFVIWLRGATTYFYHSNTPQTIGIYDGVQNALPFNEPGGAPLTYKTEVDKYVNSWGKTNPGTTYNLGPGVNYFQDVVGIGTQDTRGYKLAVNGNIRAKEIRVETDHWPDYVFLPDYKLSSLEEIEHYISKNGHLPKMPKATDVITNGVDLGEMNRLLLEKIEELTLHLIEKDKNERRQQMQLVELSSKLEKLLATQK